MTGSHLPKAWGEEQQGCESCLVTHPEGIGFFWQGVREGRRTWADTFNFLALGILVPKGHFLMGFHSWIFYPDILQPH